MKRKENLVDQWVFGLSALRMVYFPTKQMKSETV